MNTLAPRSQKRRSLTPLLWASGGTLVLHAVFLLALWLWPRPPVKPQERLLVVDLTKPTPVPKPTPRPTPVPHRIVVPPPTSAPRPTAKPRPLIHPRRTPKTRIAKIPPLPTLKPLPTAKPTVIPTAIPTVIPTAIPTVAPTTKPIRTSKPPVAPKTVPTRPSRPLDQNTSKNSTKKSTPRATPAPTNSPKKPQGSRPAGGNASPPNPNPANARPSGGKSGNLLASNGGPAEEPNGRPQMPSTSDSSKSGSNKGGHNHETAGSPAGLNLPRTRSPRGRGNHSDSQRSSAPISSKDGTELQIGASSPSAPSGRRRPVSDFGNGDDENGAPRTGGLSHTAGTSNSGGAKAGSGDNEMAGDGVSNGRSGAGARGGSSHGRKRSHSSGDPFGNGGGPGGYDKGTGASGDGGTGQGPSGGTRLAKRGLGDGDSDGDGHLGRGTGTGTGTNPGGGSGDGSRGTPGKSNGGDDEDSIGSAKTGIGRTRSTHNTHRATETEDEIGRGIWGGFKMSFYQDKPAYPDTKDIRTLEGKPIDWPVFSGKARTTTSDNLDFKWDTTSPIEGLTSTYWSMKAQGTLFVPKDDTYKFFFGELDDGGRLYLDGQPIIDIWKIQKSTPSSGEIKLTRGKHDIRIEYVQGPATEASIKLLWSSKTFTQETVGVYKSPEDK